MVLQNDEKNNDGSSFKIHLRAPLKPSVPYCLDVLGVSGFPQLWPLDAKSRNYMIVVIFPVMEKSTFSSLREILSAK